MRGDTVYVHARDTDAVARYLLTRTAARDLEITSRNLEEAFLTLTADDDRPGAPDDHRSPHRRATLPKLGGFSPTFIGLELRRMLRNRRTVIFTLVMPAVFFLLFGTNARLPHRARRRRQRHRLHPDQHGRVRRDAGHHQRRRDGVHRAGRRLEPAAAADPAAAGRVRRGEAGRWRWSIGAVSVAVAFAVGVAVRGRAARRTPGSSAGCWPGCARWCSPRSGCSWATCCRART